MAMQRAQRSQYWWPGVWRTHKWNSRTSIMHVWSQSILSKGNTFKRSQATETFENSNADSGKIPNSATQSIHVKWKALNSISKGLSKAFLENHIYIISNWSWAHYLYHFIIIHWCHQISGSFFLQCMVSLWINAGGCDYDENLAENGQGIRGPRGQKHSNGRCCESQTRKVICNDRMAENELYWVFDGGLLGGGCVKHSSVDDLCLLTGVINGYDLFSNISRSVVVEVKAGVSKRMAKNCISTSSSQVL